MFKFKYLYSVILGILNHLVLSTMPILSYYYLAPYQTHNFDPLHLTIFIVILNIVLCIFLEKMLFSKVNFKQSIILTIIQLISWFAAFVINISFINDYNAWGGVFYYILWEINFSFILVSSIIGIATVNK